MGEAGGGSPGTLRGFSPPALVGSVTATRGRAWVRSTQLVNDVNILAVLAGSLHILSGELSDGLEP